MGGASPDSAIPVPRLKNDTLLRALLRQPTPYTPVWLMRQAGRYLPEYNATRRRAGSFLALAKSPGLATEVTLQPLARFRLDAAIVFSDILTLPDAMGLGLGFAEGEGPRFERPLREEHEIRKLAAPDPQDRLGYVLETLRQVRSALAGRVSIRLPDRRLQLRDLRSQSVDFTLEIADLGAAPSEGFFLILDDTL